MRELNLPWIKFEYLPATAGTQSSRARLVDNKVWRLANLPAPDFDALHDRVQQELHLQSHDRLLLRNHFDGQGWKPMRYFASAVCLRK